MHRGRSVASFAINCENRRSSTKVHSKSFVWRLSSGKIRRQVRILPYGFGSLYLAVTEDGLVKGALLGGLLYYPTTKSCSPRILSKSTLCQELLKYKDYFNHIPMVSTLRTEALSDILYSVAIFVSYGTQALTSPTENFRHARCNQRLYFVP